MKITKLLSTLLFAAAVFSFTGCKTGADGKRTVDITTVDQIKNLVEPVAAREVRQFLVHSPEHAQVIAPYLAGVGSVFCTMSLSNRFEPAFLIDQIGHVLEVKLGQDPGVANGWALDLKDAVIAGYKILWGDRLHAEIPEDAWMHKVCEFFCETITQALNDAGYPGGLKTSVNLPPPSKTARVRYSQQLAAAMGGDFR